MIVIGLGSNLTGRDFSHPRDVLMAALQKMPDHDIRVSRVSRFFESEPVPVSDQPRFVNAAAVVATDLAPHDLLAALHRIELTLGRERRIRWEARIIDLDILAYEDHILPSAARWREIARRPDRTKAPEELVIPHPRLHERLFVLKPMMDICPDWRHPVLLDNVCDLAAAVTQDAGPDAVRPLPERTAPQP